jgi:peroxiredoxin
MRAALATLALALGALAAPAHAARPAFDAAAARPAIARHALRDLDGRSITVASLRGEVVVLAFWASWCAPCRRELPELDHLHAQLAPRGGRVLAVSIDQDVENARRFARRLRLALPVVHDGPDGLARTLDLAAIPFTVVLDRDGAVAHVAAGGDPRALATLAAEARRLAAARPPATAAGTEDQP